jgi:hypothetical protein
MIEHAMKYINSSSKRWSKGINIVDTTQPNFIVPFTCSVVKHKGPRLTENHKNEANSLQESTYILPMIDE